jgi:oxygen-independent coproporphyrinogen-3 oxidase
MQSLGLYIHIPFCRSKCRYCDFCSFPNASEQNFEDYVTALCRDLQARATDCADYRVDTVYVGGGTPTILPWRLLEKILVTVMHFYHVSADAEITAECNPKTANAEKLTAMRRMGFNRLSIGMQSAQEEELRALGRIHSFSDFCATFSAARDAGFNNISADLMMGIPHQTVASYLDTVERLCSIAPEHISAYGLIVEEGTPFGKMGDKLILPAEEAEEEMYFRGIERLAEYGYRQYEISNFAKRGYESRHNLRYWNCEEFLGFGPAAYSDYGGARFGNSRDLAAYIAGKDIVADCEYPTPNERMNEYVMLRMRLADGVILKDFEARFGVSFESVFGARLDGLNVGHLLTRTADRIAFTPAGMRVSNAILAELLDFGC